MEVELDQVAGRQLLARDRVDAVPLNERQDLRESAPCRSRATDVGQVVDGAISRGHLQPSAQVAVASTDRNVEGREREGAVVERQASKVRLVALRARARGAVAGAELTGPLRASDGARAASAHF